MLAAIDLATVDFAARHEHKPLAGVILGGYALGSMAGGLWYGSRTWRARCPTSMAKITYRRRRVTAQPAWKKSHASIVAAWVRRNCCQAVWLRCSAGGIRSRLTGK